MNRYDRGSSVLLSCAFTNATGAPAAPTAVTLRVLSPTGGETDYTAGFQNSSVGVYKMAVSADVSGTWRYRWEASGAVVAATDGAFFVSSTPFAG